MRKINCAISEEMLKEAGVKEIEKDGRPALAIPMGEKGNAYICSDRDGVINCKSSRRVDGEDIPYGLEELNQSQPVIVVGSELNALAVRDMGGRAIALGSSGNIYKLIAVVNSLEEVPMLILSVEDNKEFAGVNARLAQKLSTIMADYKIANVAGVYDEAYNALIYDRGVLYLRIYELTNSRYDTQNGISLLEDYLNTAPAKYYPTGYDTLDEALGGGLVPGLAVIGAVPSLGKTTFALQMAAQMAEAGQDVYYYNLESSARSMLIRVLSRLTYCINPWYAMSYPEINKKQCDSRQAEILQEAINQYCERIAEQLYIVEGDATVDTIRTAVHKHMDKTGRRPVVVVDYLQYLMSGNSIPNNATDKQVIDSNLRGLKGIARDFRIPVIAISAYNRDSFYGSLAMTSNSGSGQIDYLAETSIALTYKDLPAGRDKIEEYMHDIAADDKAGKEIMIQCDICKGRDSGQGTLNFALTRKYYNVRSCEISGEQDNIIAMPQAAKLQTEH